MPTRDEMWEKLGEDVDLLVIGGGITGVGIARDAVRRGLSVALVEMNDLAFGTSSRSSKLVHGGLRYLEHYEFQMVFESVSERRILMDLAPHLVNPLGFLFPVYEDARQSLFMINAGMWIYDGLSLFRSPKRHQKLKPKDVSELEPALTVEKLKGAPLYYDCATDDARLTLETALDAAAHGATIATGAKVTSFLKSKDGHVRGAVVKDTLGGALKEVRARVVVNATGPWTDRTMAMSTPKKGAGVLRPTKGVHLVVEREVLPITNAVVCFHPTDQRVLFAIPWGDHTYVGTTDTDFEGDPADVAATRDDVDYLIEAAVAYFPEHRIQHEDVISTWAGLRPLIAPPSEGGEVDESAVSREHEILMGEDGLITIAGGKLTTYRKMAAEVVDHAVQYLRLRGERRRYKHAETEFDPLPGAVGWPEDDDHDAVANLVFDAGKGAVDGEVARHLADRYGMRAIEVAELCRDRRELAARIVKGRPAVHAEIVWGATRELATSVSDIMIRRTQLFYRARDQGAAVTDAVAQRLGETLGWTDTQMKESADAYRVDVARSRRWRDE